MPKLTHNIMKDICIYWRHKDELLSPICITISRITLSVLVHKQAVLVPRREFQFPNAGNGVTQKEKSNGICYCGKFTQNWRLTRFSQIQEYKGI